MIEKSYSCCGSMCVNKKKIIDNLCDEIANDIENNIGNNAKIHPEISPISSTGVDTSIKENVIQENVIQENVIQENIIQENVIQENIIQENMTNNLIINNNIKFITYDDELVIHNLTIIKSLKTKQKLWLENNKLSIDNSWFQSYSRKMYSQSKDNILNFLKEFYEYVIKYKYNNNKIMDLVHDTRIGLINLVQTYPTKSREISYIFNMID